MNETTLRVGVVGTGRWGPNVIGALNRIPSVSVTKVADRDEKALANLSIRFPEIAISGKNDDVLGDSTLDAIAICTPVKTHLDIAESALEAGKHVFVEKPFGQEPDRCLDLVSLAKNRELILLVGLVFLFNSSIIALKKILDSGQLGRIYHLEAHRTNLGPVRKDVNAVWDLTSHDLSIFDFLLDSMPNAVSCLGSYHLDPKIEDTTYTTFQYPKGVIAHAHASWLNPRKVRQITIVGSEKMAVWDDLNIEHPITIYDSSIGLDQSYYSDSFASHRQNYHRGDVVQPFTSSNEPLLDELFHFVSCIRGNDSNNRSDGKYGTEAARTLRAADLSLASKGVLIPIERDHLD